MLLSPTCLNIDRKQQLRRQSRTICLFTLSPLLNTLGRPLFLSRLKISKASNEGRPQQETLAFAFGPSAVSFPDAILPPGADAKAKQIL